MTGLLLALGTGLAAGLHSATWGMYKDAPHEGFQWSTYVRSPILAAAIAVAIVAGTEFDPTSAAAIVLLFGVTYGLERAFLEIYKTFLRVEDQSKYTIPMQFAIRGKVVESSALRWLAAALYVGTEMLVLFAVYWLQRSGPALHPLLIVFLVGSAGGWISAIGGAWKDAPVEGFLIFKFFRSPGIAFMYGILLGSLTTSYVFIFIGSIGFTIATIETYKTFFFPQRPRGKFMGKTPLFPEFIETRTRFVPLYVVIWLGVLISGVLALLGPREGVLF
ncbi:MAG: hypothetical protein IH968_08995 [Gemmatimonadetes bacterium]|nr:hypothetical protein [Gemmatimonadota bacterium]